MKKSIERRTLTGYFNKEKKQAIHLYEDVYFDASECPQIQSDFKIVFSDLKTKTNFNIKTLKNWGDALDFYNNFLNKIKLRG